MKASRLAGTLKKHQETFANFQSTDGGGGGFSALLL
jgi:hypothetical protein